MTTYTITVGNIGTVHEGNNPVTANAVYGDYKNQSKNGCGRAAGESVTLWADGEPTREFIGANDQND